MKNLALAAAILLAAQAAQAASVRYDLNGEWQAEFHNPDKVEVEKIMIVDYGNGLTATKETGDEYVPAGKVTFQGTYTSSPFQVQDQRAQKGYINPSWMPATITVLDKDHFNISYTGSGGIDHWQRIGKPVLALDNSILFDLDKYQLKPDAAQTLDKVVAWLNQMHPVSHLLVAGYTDDTGADALNLSLSQKRAATVAAALKAKGIAPARLATQGLGKSNPRYPNVNDDSRAHNRRVEIVIQD